MGLFGSARKVALTARHVANAGSEGGEIRLVPGDPAVTARLEQILRVPVAASPPERALAVFAVAPSADPTPIALRVADRARRGERSMVVVIGRPHERAEAERALLDTGAIEMSGIAHVGALDLTGEREVLNGVLRALPSGEIVAAARTNPELRQTVTRKVVSKNARTAGVLASGAFGGRAGMVALGFSQVRMLGDLAAIRDRNLTKEDALDVVAVAGSGLIWRMVGRTAVLRSGRPILARGAVAYAATRGIGLAAQKRFTGERSGALAPAQLLATAKGLAGRARSLKQGKTP